MATMSAVAAALDLAKVFWPLAACAASGWGVSGRVATSVSGRMGVHRRSRVIIVVFSQRNWLRRVDSPNVCSGRFRHFERQEPGGFGFRRTERLCSSAVFVGQVDFAGQAWYIRDQAARLGEWRRGSGGFHRCYRSRGESWVAWWVCYSHRHLVAGCCHRVWREGWWGVCYIRHHLGDGCCLRRCSEDDCYLRRYMV